MKIHRLDAYFTHLFALVYFMIYRDFHGHLLPIVCIIKIPSYHDFQYGNYIFLFIYYFIFFPFLYLNKFIKFKFKFFDNNLNLNLNKLKQLVDYKFIIFYITIFDIYINIS